MERASVNGVGEDGVMAFTDFGIENLIDLIKSYKEMPWCLSIDRRCCKLMFLEQQALTFCSSAARRS